MRGGGWRAFRDYLAHGSANNAVTDPALGFQLFGLGVQPPHGGKQLLHRLFLGAKGGENQWRQLMGHFCQVVGHLRVRAHSRFFLAHSCAEREYYGDDGGVGWCSAVAGAGWCPGPVACVGMREKRGQIWLRWKAWSV